MLLFGLALEVEKEHQIISESVYGRHYNRNETKPILGALSRENELFGRKEN